MTTTTPTLNGKGGGILPAPAVFALAARAIVGFVSVNGDYTQRPEPDEALALLDSLELLKPASTAARGAPAAPRRVLTPLMRPPQENQ